MADLISVEVKKGVWKEIDWPFCKVKGCLNRQWRVGESDYCYPHSHVKTRSRYDILLGNKKRRKQTICALNKPLNAR
jgi:hypothetical protein